MKNYILLLLIAGTITQSSRCMTQDPYKRVYDIIYSGDSKALKDLLTNMPRFNVSLRNPMTGETALTMIAGKDGKFDKLEKMKILLNKGADVNARNDAGLTPLDKAIRSANEPEVKLLLDYCANPLIENLDGISALDRAKNIADMATDPTMKAAAQRNLDLVQNAATKFSDSN